MSKSVLSRTFQIVAVMAAVFVTLFAAGTHPESQLLTALMFAALLAATAFLRIDAGERSVRFEAPVAFAAIIIFHDPSLVAMTVLLGLLVHAAVRSVARRAMSFTELADAGVLSLSYFVVALLYSSAVAPTAPPMAKLSGYILIVVGFGAMSVAVAWLSQLGAEPSGILDVRSAIAVQVPNLILLSPLVAVEVMLYARYGKAGLLVAFVPLLTVAYAMRHEAEVSLRNFDLTQRNRDLSLLTENSMQILSAEDDEQTLSRLIDLLSKLARLKACAAVTWESNPDVPATVYRFGECMRSDQEILRWVDGAGLANSAPSRVFVFKDDLRRFPLSNGPATQVLIGIQTPEVIYGILLFETDDLSILKAGSLNLLVLMVNQTALALQDQLLRREMRSKTSQLEAQAATTATILNVANRLIGSFDVDGALTTIAQAVRKALGFEVVVFGLLDSRRGDYVRRAHAGLDDVWEEMKKKVVPAAEINAFMDEEFRLSNSYYIGHTAMRHAEQDFLVHAEHRTSSEEWHENDKLITPLMSGDQIVGYLLVREPSDRRAPSLEKVQTLEIFAAQAVTALQSVRYVEEIKRLTHIDALTPAFNHRYFQEALGKEISRDARSGQEFALLMIDIDNFKKINDTFGHPTGDEILKGLVEELMLKARDNDVIARYGGEEFAIILPDTAITAAREAAERFRELVARRDFPLPQFGRTLHVTVSIGVAVYPRDGGTGTDLVARADEALYLAKKSGKDRVAMAADLPESGKLAL